MKDETPTYIKIAEAFMRDLAAQFSLDCLATPEKVERHDDETTLVVTAAFTPSGQMAVSCCSAKVKVTVSADAARPGLYFARVGYAYRHRNGGLNGTDTDFIIATDLVFGEYSYRGYVERSAFDAIRRLYV